MLYKKVCFKKFAKFTGKHMCQILFFNKVAGLLCSDIFAKITGYHIRQSLFSNKIAGLRPATLLKKETLVKLFSCHFCRIFKNTFFIERFWTTASKGSYKKSARMDFLRNILTYSNIEIYYTFLIFLPLSSLSFIECPPLTGAENLHNILIQR